MMLFPLDFDETPAIIDGDTKKIYSYLELKSLSELFPKGNRSLVFIFIQNEIDCIAAYLGAMNRGHVVCLLDSSMDNEYQRSLISHYQPLWVVDGRDINPTNYERIDSPWDKLVIYQARFHQQTPTLHSELQLLLSTSGTTGSIKLIRLSKQNILENAKSIISYLKIEPQEKAMLALPISYSFGLSILHTHLLKGASIVITKESFTQKRFFSIMQEQKCTSVSGVPFFYSFLNRMKFNASDYPSLKTMTHAGGRLEGPLIIKFHEMMKRNHGLFYSMYGQTEATARIAYLPPRYLPEKAGAIGVAIPGGRLSLKDGIAAPNVEGELIYEGPNVMLGISSRKEDLSLGNECHGQLFTGDLGIFDEDGIFYITGRIKRIAKIYGNRINLDEIENELHVYGPVAAVASDEKLILYYENQEKGTDVNMITLLSKKTHLHPSCFKAIYLSKLPRTERGKIDYNRL